MNAKLKSQIGRRCKADGNRLVPVISLSFCALLSVNAHAEILLLSQNRSVSASAGLACGGPADSSSVTATQVGVFNEFVSERMSGQEANANGGSCLYTNESLASNARQNTNVGTSGIQGTGRSNADKAGGAMESGAARSSSLLNVNFAVETPISYQFNGAVDGCFSSLFPGQGSALAALLGDGGVIHEARPNPPEFFCDGTRNDFAFSGVLGPGNYELVATAYASAFGPTEGSDFNSFAFTFSAEPIPEPATEMFGLLGLLCLTVDRLKYCTSVEPMAAAPRPSSARSPTAMSAIR